MARRLDRSGCVPVVCKVSSCDWLEREPLYTLRSVLIQDKKPGSNRPAGDTAFSAAGRYDRDPLGAYKRLIHGHVWTGKSRKSS